MRALIVFNHPYDESYCSAILKSVITGLEQANHETDLIHLDKDGFNPVMTAQDLKRFTEMKYANEGEYVKPSEDPLVLNYKERLEKADQLIFIFPIWWELMPAMTKGFIDKMIFPGIAYQYEDSGKKMKPRLNLKSITLITTMNTPSILYRWLFGNAIRYAFFTGTFWKLGYKNRKWISLNMVKFVSDKKRKKWLTEIEERFRKMR